jgi:hypothetical protein
MVGLGVVENHLVTKRGSSAICKFAVQAIILLHCHDLSHSFQIKIKIKKTFASPYVGKIENGEVMNMVP